MSKKLFHWRYESGELDVFEAANYFAGSNDHHQVSNCHNNNNGPTFSHKLLRQGCNNQAWRSSGRMSLDMPPVPAIKLSSTPFGTSSQTEKPAVAAMKGKIPSSPGGKLASFLNSLFNQKPSSKKKKKQKLNSNANNEDSQTPSGWIRRRRSSLSELYGKRSSSNTTVSASSNSGFRTPPPYPKNSSCKDNHNPESMFKFIRSGISSERRTMMMTSVHHWADEYPSEEHEERKFEDDYDHGTDSDSSSDLFDLPNRELLDCFSTGLPVYQTTQMNAPISATVI